MRSIAARQRATQRFRERWRNDPTYRAKKAAACRKFRKDNPDYDAKLSNRFAGLRSKCKSRGYEFALSFQQYTGLVEGKTCFYCGADLTNSRGASLDRVDSSIGYLIDNCVPCCYLCNVMKSDMSQEGFYARIERILAYRRTKLV